MTPFPKLILVLCFHAVVVRSEVGNDFSNCDQFFYKGIPPLLQRHSSQPPKSICQWYKNDYHYATLYSTDLRIPLFSAYTLSGPCQGRQTDRMATWFVEPQVSYSQFLTILFKSSHHSYRIHKQGSRASPLSLRNSAKFKIEKEKKQFFL